MLLSSEYTQLDFIPEFILLILTKDEFKDNFILNGSTGFIDGSDFNTVTGSSEGWVYLYKSFSLSQIPDEEASLIQNTSGHFHLGILNKKVLSSEYGYFSNYSSVNLGRNYSICKGDSSLLDAGPDKDSYLWNTGDTTQTITITDTGYYSVEVRIGDDCIIEDNIHVSFYPTHPRTLAQDTTICEGDTLLLNAGDHFTSYTWNDGSTDQFKFISSEGEYRVQMTDTNGCTSYDTVNIVVSPLPWLDLGEDRPFSDTMILLDAGPDFLNYLWQDNSPYRYYEARFPGVYSVIVTDTNLCVNSDEIILGADIKVYAPNAFTPNNDGTNDIFKVKYNYPVFEYYTFAIYNRWGERVFETNNPNAGWDGTKNGQDSPNGAYVWVLKYKGLETITHGNEGVMKGSFTLLR